MKRKSPYLLICLGFFGILLLLLSIIPYFELIPQIDIFNLTDYVMPKLNKFLQDYDKVEIMLANNKLWNAIFLWLFVFISGMISTYLVCIKASAMDINFGNYSFSKIILFILFMILTTLISFIFLDFRTLFTRGYSSNFLNEMSLHEYVRWQNTLFLLFQGIFSTSFLLFMSFFLSTAPKNNQNENGL